MSSTVITYDLDYCVQYVLYTNFIVYLHCIVIQAVYNMQKPYKKMSISVQCSPLYSKMKSENLQTTEQSNQMLQSDMAGSNA